MKSEERAQKSMRRNLKRDVVKKRSGLQLRVTISYALTTLVAVLFIEILVGTILFTLLKFSPLADSDSIAGARQTAKLYALAAAAEAGGTVLDPHTTFESGQPSSIALSNEYFSSIAGDIQYINTRSSDTQNTAFALLITPDGHVLASSYPARYPVSTLVAQLLPSRSHLIMKAMAGVPGSTVEGTSEGRIVGVVETIWSREKAIGAVYLQVPAEVSGGSFLQGFAGLLLISGLFCLLITLPVGGLFGLITTRGLVRRLRHLVTATTQFAGGDYSQRVPTTKQDEVGQLERHFNQMAEQLVESMAQRQILVEHNARHAERTRIEQEMRTAQHIQLSLLPKDVPALSGWQFTPYYKPAKEVGGDFYDFLSFDDGRLGIIIGDVADKGVPAALVMAITRTMLRTAAHGTSSPGEVLARVNNLLSADIPPGMFVTCFYGILDPGKGHLHYANAGHDLPYRRHSSGVSELRAIGMPLGMMPESNYEEQEAILAPGDSVLFYSDGLVEAHNPKYDMFGFPHLMELVAEHSCDTTLINFLLGELATFTGADWEQEDDVTMVVLNRATFSPMTG